MSKWIDADALDRAFSKLRFNNDGELEHYGDRPNWYLWGSEVENLIADAPSIDIVRCQDCRYWVYNFNGCARNPCTEPWYATDFCNYGERKSDE